MGSEIGDEDTIHPLTRPPLGGTNYVLAFTPEQSQISQLKIHKRKEEGLVIAFLQEARTERWGNLRACFMLCQAGLTQFSPSTVIIKCMI